MTEKEYRIEKLKHNKRELIGKKLAIYGTGINAEEILVSFPELNILALMDEKHTGEYMYGKKIISEEEARLLKLEGIIIAAEAGSAYIVSERIRPFCMQNNIILFNMYGYDEIKLNYNILNQDIRYADCTEEDLKNKIEEYDIVCIQLVDVLCAYGSFDKEAFWCALEKKYFVEEGIGYKHFQNCRKKAEEKTCYSGMVYGIKDIYSVFRLITEISEKKCTQMCKLEQHVLIDTMIPKSRLINVVKWLAEQGKKIYIVSELRVAKEYVEELLKVLGIKQYKGIIQENLLSLTLSRGALRIGLGEDFGRKTLYIGTNKGNNLVLPQLYDMDIYMLKNSWTIMRQFSGLQRVEFTERERIDDLNRLVQYMFNSPFIKENRNIDIGKVFLVPFRIKGTKKRKELPGLLPMPKYKEFTDLDTLEFVEFNKPLVSIIIPVHNQFEYTYNCLKSILQNTETVEYEVILADDCSTDETCRIEEIVRGIRILQNQENLFFLRNCNHASNYARGKYILFLNNDTQVQVNWLFPLVQIMEKDEDVGLVGSKLLYPDGTIQEAGGIIWKNGEAFNYGRGSESGDLKYNYVREVDYITGASFMVRTVLWNEIGGFDERYVPAYCEDSDLAFEVRKHNKKVIYQPASEVVHFEGISNGRDEKTGIRTCQKVNIQKLRKKWKTVLEEENHIPEKHILAVCDRKGNRKSILFISNTIPSYDYDAGSKTVYNYLKLFVKKGYIVKFMPADFAVREPYTMELQQIGIEVLAGMYFKDNICTWILKNQADIDYVFFHYPDCAYRFINLLESTTIKLRYYGHDLHFLRNKREYELTKDNRKLQMSQEFWEKEKYIIEKVEKVFYPSKVEVELVKNLFKKEKVSQMMAYIYDMEAVAGEYRGDIRQGLMFIGGFGHTPNVDAVLWFIKEIYPQVYKVRQIPFYIIGSGVPAEIQQLSHPGIQYKGYLTNTELEEFYEKVKLVVIPLRYGAGIKGKAIEAMYHGIPIVSTSVGMEGIINAENCAMIADDSYLFAKTILDLYEDDAKLRELSLASRNNIQKYYSEEAAWDMIKNDF